MVLLKTVPPLLIHKHLVKVEVGDIQHKNKLTPYLGRKLRGVVYRYWNLIFWSQGFFRSWSPWSIIIWSYFFKWQFVPFQHRGGRKGSVFQSRRLQRFVTSVQHFNTNSLFAHFFFFKCKILFNCFPKEIHEASSCLQKNQRIKAFYKIYQTIKIQE